LQRFWFNPLHVTLMQSAITGRLDAVFSPCIVKGARSKLGSSRHLEQQSIVCERMAMCAARLEIYETKLS
jgi:hypothetical protein